jgi:drug/metabolite transporter (DMT)-like permease
MGALLGLLGAFSITGNEIFSRRISDEFSAIAAAAIASLLAAVTTVFVALAIGGSWVTRDLLIGALSGVGYGAGLASYLTGLRVSSSAVMGPTVAALFVLLPFSYAASVDGVPSAFGFLGSGLVLTGLGFVTIGGGAASNVRAGVTIGIRAGLGYGIGSALLIEISEDSGQWPIVAQRLAAFVTIAGFALLRHQPVFPPRRYTGWAIAAGVFGSLSSVFVLLGYAVNAAATSVTASLFPASSVAAGRVLFGDAVNRAQVVGLVIVLFGTVAIVLA